LTGISGITYQRPNLTNYQTEILDNPERFTITEAGTKTGKTVSHIVWLFEEGLKIKPGQFVWWVAPVYQQAEIAFRRMKAYIKPKELYTTNSTKMRITLVTGGTIEFKSADNPDNLYGEDVHAAVFDEFTRAREQAWWALRSTLTATGGKCKMIGNVKGKKNWGHKLGMKAKAGEPNYAYYRITVVDAIREGIIPAEELEQARRDLPEEVFKELYMAEASEDGANPFGVGHIQNCIIDKLAEGEVVAYGIDIAKSVDWTVIIGLNKDREMCYFARFQKDWQMTKAFIIGIVGDKFGYIDSTGVGNPVTEDIRKVCRKLVGYNFTPMSKQNLMEQLAIDIQNGRLKILAGVTVDEMEQFEFSYSGSNVKYSAPSGMHDDAVCSLALANFAFNDRNKRSINVW
jgi:hypothetical protein